jgi:16S rRNA (adenine1518-N6/adenine1519-N6)-dimethyltransferase
VADDLLGARRVRELLEAQGVRPSKSLGQNFVIDPNTIRKVISVADIHETDHVLEIGAGAGSLTIGLAGAATRVTAIEVDPQLLPALAEVTGARANVSVVHADALHVDLAGIGATTVVANLPYNIATLVVLKLLEEAPTVRSLTVMTQREVGDRLTATPGSKIYGQTTVMTAFFAAARMAGTVSRNAFWPVPRVESAIVRIDRRAKPEVEWRSFVQVVRAAFAQRRKMLRQTIASIVGSSAVAEEVLIAAGISPEDRAEQLGLEDFVRLTSAIGERS